VVTSTKLDKLNNNVQLTTSFITDNVKKFLLLGLGSSWWWQIK